MNEESIFARALDVRDPAERAAFLDRECAGNPDLRREVEELLSAHAGAGGFLNRADLTAAHEPAHPAAPKQVGPYKLLQKIGEGGMGAVYMAEQLEPVRRMVAVKIIRPGMDSERVVARFEAERQALALMDHPNIAKVLDAGTTDDGRPFFVMELVKGVPITKFCDDNKLTPRERLELFVPVCRAIQHAHQKGVIHRDIKPTNVLVTLYDGKPVPKVIDFGIAKATAQRLTEKTLFTEFGALVGTPEYMSPEQAEMNALDIDTRSDVYSLGVLLYELLTGFTPVDRKAIREAGYSEMLRLIREVEPQRPSARISGSKEAAATISEQRKTDPTKLARLVRGELDWIVMRALEKDRNRRYDSANGLAKEVEAYLRGDAVEACPPTLGYRLRKAYRRNRAAVLTAAAFAAVLLAAVGMSLAFGVLAKRAEADAVAARNAESDQRDLAVKAGNEAADERDKSRIALKDLQAAQDRTRRTLYASELNLVPTAWNANDLPRVLRLLDSQRPKLGGTDLRGFEWHYWNNMCHRELSTRTLPERLSHSTTISPDGRFIATVTARDGAAVVRVLDATTGREVFSVPMPTAPPDPNAGSTSQPYLAFSASGGRLLILWSLRAGQSSRLIVRSVPDGKSLLDKTAAYNNYSLAVSDSRVAVRVGDGQYPPRPPFNGDLVVYRLDDGEEEFRRPSPFNPNDVTFSGDGRLLAVSTSSTLEHRTVGGPLPTSATTVHVLCAGCGEEVNRVSNLSTLRFVALNRDGTRLVGWRTFTSRSPERDHEPDGWVWDTATGKQLATLGGLRSASRMSLSLDLGQCVAFSPDGARTLWYSPYPDGHPRVSVRDAASGTEVVSYDSLSGIDLGAAFTADGTRVRTVGRDGTIKDWPVPPRDPDPSTTVNFVAADPAGRRMLVTKRTGVREGFGYRVELQLVRPDGGQPVVLDKPAQLIPVRISAAFSPDGRAVATAEIPRPQDTNPRFVQVWDATTGKNRWRQPLTGNLVSVDYTADGRWLGVLVSGTADGKRGYHVVTFDAESGVPGPTHRTASQGAGSSTDLLAHAVPFSTNGRQVAALIRGTGGEPDVISVRDLAPDREHQHLVGPAGFYTVAVAFSPDGSQLAATFTSEIVPAPSFMQPQQPVPNLTGRVVVWDLVSGRELWSATSAYGQGRQLAYSRDGSRLAVTYWNPRPATRPSGAGSEVVVYDAVRGTERFQLCRDVPGRVSLVFSPDSQRIAMLSAADTSRGEVKVWDADTGRELLTLPSGSHAEGVRFTHDGTRLMAWGGVTAIGLPLVWDATPRPNPEQP